MSTTPRLKPKGFGSSKNMKIWKIEAYIESEDDVSKKHLISEIETRLNRGDGYYFDTDNSFVLKLIKKVKDSEFEL